jgi:hypothetical protein
MVSSEKYVDCFIPVVWTPTGTAVQLQVTSEYGVWVEFVARSKGALSLLKPTLVRPRPLPSVYSLTAKITGDKKFQVFVDGELYKEATYDSIELPSHAAVCARGSFTLQSVGEKKPAVERSVLHEALIRRAATVNQEGKEMQKLSEFIATELPKQIKYPVTERLLLKFPSSSPLIARKDVQQHMDEHVLAGLKTKWGSDDCVWVEVNVDGLATAM